MNLTYERAQALTEWVIGAWLAYITWLTWLIVIWHPRPVTREDPQTGWHRSARLLVKERAR